MSPAVEHVVNRQVALIYDGTNAADLVDLMAPYLVDVYHVQSEQGGVLVLASSSSIWDPITLNVGDRLIVPSMQTAPADRFAAQYTAITPA